MMQLSVRRLARQERIHRLLLLLRLLPTALLLLALWVVAYFCFALSPLAGVLYIDVFPAIELPNAEAFAPLLVGTMVIGGLGWVAAIVAIVLACCALCGC